MSAIPRNLVHVFFFFLIASAALLEGGSPGFLEGHLRIISPKEVDLGDGTPSQMTAHNYIDYPLVILSRDQKTEIAHVTPDENGNYRIGLPPGDYLLDVQNRKRRHVRATPHPFTVMPNQTVHLDMVIDTGVR
jgi:hypothetical protein